MALPVAVRRARVPWIWIWSWICDGSPRTTPQSLICLPPATVNPYRPEVARRGEAARRIGRTDGRTFLFSDLIEGGRHCTRRAFHRHHGIHRKRCNAIILTCLSRAARYFIRWPRRPSHAVQLACQSPRSSTSRPYANQPASQPSWVDNSFEKKIRKIRVGRPGRRESRPRVRLGQEASCPGARWQTTPRHGNASGNKMGKEKEKREEKKCMG